MTETPPESGGGRKILGLKPRTALIAGGAILAASVGYLLWKRKKSAPTTTAAASATASTSSSTGMGYGGELSVIQSELEDLLAAQGQAGTTSTGSAGSTGTSTGTSTATSATTTTSTAAAGPPPVPTGVHSTQVTASSVTLAWNKSAGATSYQVRVTYQSKLVGSPHTGITGTSATISGLGADHTYTFHVAAIGPGGTSSETNGPAVKTSRS